ncbi:MAG: hypothetical protein RL754_14 [Bacteroidota bacterium]|jgi:hypothetical protein
MGALRYINNWRQFLEDYGHWRLLMAEFNKVIYLRSYLKNHREEDRKKTLHHGVRWLVESIKVGRDEGSGTYYFNTGWTSSYPETTGYIIPTLLDYAQWSEAHWAQEARSAAFSAGHWLLDIQHEDGGWPGGYVHQERPSVVFNTGQILRGMKALYDADQNEDRTKWKNAAERAILWIWEQLDEEGRFSKNDFMGATRVYGTYVVAPILDWLPEFESESSLWKTHARRHLDWVLTQQNDLGWLANCDNTLHKNDRPIIHTIAYTLDGLWDAGRSLDDERYTAAAEVGARYLATEFLQRGILNGRYDKAWKGSESFIPTGGAQLAILWHKMHQHTGEAIWKAATLQMNTLLSVIATRGAREPLETAGAITGSFPLWGRYEPMGLPNWATKYMVDSLLNEFAR